MNKVQANGMLFTDTDKVQLLFGLHKKQIDTVKSFLGFLNRLLKGYGLMVRTEDKTVHVKIDNKRKSIKSNKYILSYKSNISNYL